MAFRLAGPHRAVSLRRTLRCRQTAAAGSVKCMSYIVKKERVYTQHTAPRRGGRPKARFRGHMKCAAAGHVVISPPRYVDELSLLRGGVFFRLTKFTHFQVWPTHVQWYSVDRTRRATISP
jgi:hypothetical protein